ncbi:hypothetical protein ACO0K3_03910 [Undibacterium sp. Rencai35W]|uniref:hypothetical protein n=1 Tax=Undibacterium sp. Rencai35W TaxID=3413046 RepID=UPI003BF07911
MKKQIIDLLNQRFGRLLVTSYILGKWLCQCDCGNTRSVQGHHLRNGNTKSCGCYRNEFSEIHVTTHGQSKSALYLIWTGMKDRCGNPNNPNYDRYGGRRITVCDRWANSFEDFSADVGKRPRGTSLDRIDNDGNYEPSNCRWATKIVQARNTSGNRYFTINSEKRSLAEWCEINNLPYQRVYARLKRGRTIEQALGA